jgi:hypothetical protein
MTSAQLEIILSSNPFVMLRHYKGYTMAVNSKVSSIAKRGRVDIETDFVSYRPCNFMEYISNKTPFITT